ncbi:glycerol kinase [Clostridium cochlearium]|uniref:Glycerol kinase n=1 Tax=Clostridium cochlearium TaxID=1494 RepID=A0ABY0QIP2_CLOCO|nr:glycerol kinase GlpK [Clostridium cochlearium]SDK89376.1 glycerol kinase [Clostridium cochlearium]
MERYIMVLDQGSTRCKCILFNKKGETIGESSRDVEPIYPKLGWVEYNPVNIWASQFSAITELLAKHNISIEKIASIGITNQRETIVVWDKRTGIPVYNAIAWQCRRTVQISEELNKRGYGEVIKEKTGLVLDPYFSATKIKWILDNVEGAREEAEKGNLAFGTMDSWLIWNLTKGEKHITDYSNASRTMLFNIHTLQWDKELLEIFQIPKSILPEVLPSSYVYGYTDSILFGKEIAIGGIAGDQNASLFGQIAFEEGSAKNTYGTGCFMLMNTGNKPINSQKGLITTIAWGLDGEITYALEGSVFMAGEGINWIKDNLRMIDSLDSAEKYALAVENTNNVYMVPAFGGLGAPYWDPEARGIVIGITRGTKKEHFIRAVIESLAYQSYDVLKAMEEDSGIVLKKLRVDGQYSTNNFLMQFQSDILDCKVEKPKNILNTAGLGAAYFAGLAVGFWENKEEILKNNGIEKEFESSIDDKKRKVLIDGWKEAIKRTI